MAWTSLEDEAALLTQLEQTTSRVAVDVVGGSVQDRPIRLVRVGMPPPAATDRALLLHVGLQHANEPAGREGLLQWIEHLATTEDSAEQAFLAAHGVLIVPTANPDGLVTMNRANAAGQDPNRQHIRLLAPEALAISEVIRRARPTIVVDHHEAAEFISPGIDIGVQPGQNPMIHPSVRSRADDLTAAMLARAAAESWTNELYDFPFNEDERLLHNAGSLRYGAGVLIETRRTDDSQSGQEHRVDMHYAMAEEALAYAIAHESDLISDADGAAQDRIADGAAGTLPFDLRTEVIDPPPLGYRMSGADFAATVTARASLGITAAGPVVPMAQAAYGVIPYLLDAASTSPLASAARLFDLTPPAELTVTDPAELAPIVSGSHRVRMEALVVPPGQAGSDPDGVEIPVLGGSVTWDGTADILGSVELTTVARWPRARERLLLPAGNEVFVRYGIDVGGAVGTLWTPLGYFRINRPSQDDVARGPITLSGEDRMSRILDARLLRPRQLSVGRTLGDIFAELVLEAMPEATIIFDDDTEYATIARTLTTEESRYSVLRELADAAGKMLYWDGEGILRIVSSPDPAEPVWHLRAGPGGALISASREISREQVYNAVVARGEGSEMADPVEAVAYDDDPDSMTYFFGPFGMVPRFYQSPVISTEDQAYSAAVSMLRRSLGLPYEVAGEIAPNPALRPGDPVRFIWDDGNRELHVWETLELPLDGESPMSGTTQQQTLGRVGRM